MLHLLKCKGNKEKGDKSVQNTQTASMLFKMQGL